ncbi:hypothetical protein ACP70R_046999 [Stipagrostis hirtigluma subsp. patula]
MSNNMQLRLRLIQLWNEWEIRVPVLLSFMLQLFLFFTGGLRRRNSKQMLRFFIWLAYLGADMIAFYTLGQISRLGDAIHERDPFTGTKTLAFFWAPFLLVHLGGQDTITAFSSEDNNLWLRHLLNLLVEVSLSLYVFWKSVGGHSTQLLVPAMLVFICGIIKYGERIWALKYGSKNDLNSTSTNYENHQLPPLSVENDRYSDIVSYALHTARYIRAFLAGRATFQMGHEISFTLVAYFWRFVDHEAKGKIVEMELAIIYDDLYTKAMVLRTWTGSIFRCVVQISTVVAFKLFRACDKEGYSGVDVAITYALLMGSICMEFLSILMSMISPWTWAFFRARNFYWLTNMSWFVFKALWPEKRRWWSNSIGNYNLLGTIVRDRSPYIVIIGYIMNALWLGKFWRSIRNTKHVDAKEKIMACVVEWLDKPDRFEDLARGMKPKLGTEIERILRGPFEHAIIQLHLFTDYHIRDPKRVNGETAHLAEICEQISNYMLYLLVVNPSMLPVSSTAEDTLSLFPEKVFSTSKEHIRDVLHKDWRVGGPEGKILLGVRALLDYRPSEDLFVELREIWIRLLVYAAGKSRAESHAQQLSIGGGELLTFVWLLMGAHYQLGDVARTLDLVSLTSHTGDGDRFAAFYFPTNENNTAV